MKARQILAIQAALCVFVTFGPGVQGTESYSFVAEWTSADGDDLRLPQGIAIDSVGNVLVADTFNNRILKFDPQGELLKKMGSIGKKDGQFDCPTDLAVDRAGNLFVVDSGNYRIQKFDSSWRFVAKWGYSGGSQRAPHYPCGIAADSKGAAFAADPRKKCILRFDNSLNFLGEWPGSLSGPYDLEFDDKGNLLVLDAEDYKVKKFDAKFTAITEWGSVGSGVGQFRHAEGIAVDSEGNVYVADTYNRRIQKFDSSGKFLLMWGSQGSGEGEFKEPTGIAVDSQGNVYVADTGNNRIQKFAPGGEKALEPRTAPRRSEEKKPAKATKLTVENVVMLKELGLDEETILQKLSDTGTAFSAQEIEQLKKAGFSDEFLSKAQKPAEPAKKSADPGKDKLKLISGFVLFKELGVSEDVILEKVQERGIAFSPEDAILLERGGFSDEFIRKLCPNWVRAEKPKDDEKQEKKPAEKGLAGTWKMTAKDGEIRLALASDGTFQWHSESGKEVTDFKGAWKKIDDESVSMRAEGNPLGTLVPCKLTDADTLEMKLQGITLQFKREEE